MTLKSAFRKLSRAFAAKDERAFDAALEELEEQVEDNEGAEPIEIHNHIPDSRDAAVGELPEKDPPGFDRRARDNEEPDWFKKYRETNDAAMKTIRDSVEGLQKWAKEESEEPEHQEDRRHDDRRHDDRHHDEEEPFGGEMGAEEENLEMDRRHDDKRHDDRRHDDRRSDDEANKAILGELEFEAPPGTGDKAKRANDSRYLEDSFQDTLSKAEVLAPGIRLPTFDSKAKPVRTAKALFSLRRTALDLAYNEPGTRGVIDEAMAGRTLDTKRMSHGQARVLFNAVASAVASNNNRRATDRSMSSGNVGNSTGVGGPIQSLADINRINREKYDRK